MIAFKAWMLLEQTTLTPKGPSIVCLGTNGIFGRKLLQVEFLSLFFETFFEDRKIDYLHGNIIIFSIGAQEQKLCPNKLKIGREGNKKMISFLNFFIS